MIENVSKYIKLLKKYNALEVKYESLRQNIKDDCFKKILEKIEESDEIVRLKKENKRLRIKIKDLKNKIQI